MPERSCPPPRNDSVIEARQLLNDLRTMLEVSPQSAPVISAIHTLETVDVLLKDAQA